MSIFCPSVMCLKMDNLKESIKELEQSGIDRFHLDVMDGVFVPNYALGLNDVEAVCRLSSIKTEIHLMTVNPGQYVHMFADLGADIIYVHPESHYIPSSAVQKIIDAGAEPGIVLSPSTSVDSIKDLLGIAKKVLVMTVNPGDAGQPYLPYVEEKIQKLIELKSEQGFELGLDGACTAERIKRYSALGVDSFVLGTAALFHKSAPYAETVSYLRSLAKGNDIAPLKPAIKYFVTDVDGTLTDGKIFMGNNGEAMKAFDIKDGYALHELLPNNGIEPVIITGRKSVIVENRAKELKIKHVFQGVQDKLSALNQFITEKDVSFEELAYIGDDASDLECIKASGLSGCPADAVDIVKNNADFVSKNPSGASAVRDFAEYIVNMQKEVAG